MSRKTPRETAMTTSMPPALFGKVTAPPPSYQMEEEDDSGDTLPGVAAAPPRVERRDRPVITFLSGTYAGKIIPIEAREVVIGRSRDATLRLDDYGISRRHVRIVHTADDRFFIEDLGSRNGTFVGSVPVTRAELASGDRIQLGNNVVLRFSLLDPAEEALAKQLFEASTNDALTKVANRRYFEERLAAELAYAQRHGTEVALLLFDLDHFKRVNDTHGHLAGDVVLRIVAAQVKRSLRVEDLIARYGGEEFAVLVRGIGREGLARLAERIRVSVSRLEIPWEKLNIGVTISMGGALLSETNAQGLVQLADDRLYRAKDTGRNRACLR